MLRQPKPAFSLLKLLCPCTHCSLSHCQPVKRQPRWQKQASKPTHASHQIDNERGRYLRWGPETVMPSPKFLCFSSPVSRGAIPHPSPKEPFGGFRKEENRRELKLLLSPSTRLPSETPNSSKATDASDHPLLDLTLSMSVGTLRPSPGAESQSCAQSLQVLRQQTAEQIRLAAAENAYAERMREVTRMEMELAEKEFARARLVWARAREEVKKVERMKEMATRRINSACLEITCHSCHQRFRP
ncbi:hypothetical protein MUK42_07362 [Musa troglodytarum]|uniref:Uncharacterized protein n=1 Tax=Musa troglodytarum TaxID=320322 RepID=A0A9E7KPN1_9LILI|nr:hypothetical protein MUK42_07362 [Musa troglodytarum]